jgi:hypothetical protein
VPVTNRQSRALSKDLAVAGHDFFEVAFYTGTQYIRASWELKTNAYISGSALRNIDFDYSYIPASLPANHGAAIIFVGKKTDKTLLGVGKMAGSTDKDGNPGTTLITPDTRSVTFAVAALESGVMDPTNSGFTDSNRKSSFYTNYKAVNPADPLATPSAALTEGTMFPIGSRNFPRFMLLPGRITRASYSFKTVFGTDFENYRQGIILAGPAEYMKKQPRYPIPGGGFQGSSLRLDDKTKITPNNNTSPNVAFVNPLTLTFDTRGVDETSGTEDDTVSGSVFALVFQVPVYPLSQNGDPGKWYIRASYDSYWLDLDAGIINTNIDGTNGGSAGSGGAVLIGMGNPGNPANWKLVLVQPPTKYKYGPFFRTADVTEYRFIVEGMIVEMRTTSEPAETIAVIPHKDLEFYIGGWQIEPVLVPGYTYAPPPPMLPPMPPGNENGDDIPSELYGMQIIKVEYVDPYTNKGDYITFPILCSGGDPLRDFTSIDKNRRFFIENNTNPGALEGLLTNTIFANGTSGTVMIILNESMDFPAITLNNNNNPGDIYGPYLVMVLAGHSGPVQTNPPRVVLGRTSATMTSGVFIDWSRRNSYYFGTWPFNEAMECRTFRNGVLLADTVGNNTIIPAGGTHPYIINAGGEAGDVIGTPPGAPVVDPGHITGDVMPVYRRFVHSGQQPGRIYNVNVMPGITILNEDYMR